MKNVLVDAWPHTGPGTAEVAKQWNHKHQGPLRSVTVRPPRGLFWFGAVNFIFYAPP